MVREKVVVVTGAAGGIGKALGQRFGLTGAKIALIDNNEDLLTAANEELVSVNITTLAVACDITDYDACQEAMRQIVDTFGEIDILINNAGITHRSPFEKTNLKVYRRVMEVNFFGSLNCTKAAFPSLNQSKGKIIVISSVAGFSPLLGRSGYCASKYALHGFFDTLRTEFKSTGISILLVCPVFTHSNLEINTLAGNGQKSSFPKSTVGKIQSSEAVADIIFKTSLTNKRILIISTKGKLARLISFLAPIFYEKIIRKNFAVELER